MTARQIAVPLGLLVLAGCGGSTKTVTERAAAPAAPPTTAAGETTAAPPAPRSGGGLTPMGTTLKVGQGAVIAYDDASNHKKSRIEVTPQKIEKGTLDDFKNIELEGDQKTSTPYYVTMRVK